MSDYKPHQSNPQYLGDGVYVSFDGYMFRLDAARGEQGIHTIYLEPAVYTALVAYVERKRKVEQ